MLHYNGKHVATVSLDACTMRMAEDLEGHQALVNTGGAEYCAHVHRAWPECHECIRINLSSLRYTARHILPTDVPYSGPETYIFECDESGNVLNRKELRGSFRGSKDHAPRVVRLYRVPFGRRLFLHSTPHFTKDS